MKRQPVLALSLLAVGMLSAQDVKLPASLPTVVVCDDPASGCSQKLVNGVAYKTLSTIQALVTVGLITDGKYARVDVAVTNTGQKQFDLLPNVFTLSLTAPKAKSLRMVPPEKIIASERHHAGWANAINAMGAGMASHQVTTQTNSSGNVQATGNDGSSASGTYNGTSTSTTSVPDYAAQARARENIAQRRAALAAHQAQLDQTALRANTMEAGQMILGSVFFEGEKHGKLYVVDIPIEGIVYRFSFQKPKP